MADQCLRLYLYTVELPEKVKEAVLKGYDDSYTIYISDKLDATGRQNALIHAFSHIVHGDFNDSDVDSIEYHAHYEGGTK